jgi:hypothetical protein
MVTKKRSWTDDENQRLRDFVARDVSIVRVAATLKRSIISVRNRARELGTPFPHMRAYREKFGCTSVNEWRKFG